MILVSFLKKIKKIRLNNYYCEIPKSIVQCYYHALSIPLAAIAAGVPPALGHVCDSHPDSELA